jgi:hypothetical protein
MPRRHSSRPNRMKMFSLLLLAAILLLINLQVDAQVHPCSGPGPGEVVVGQTEVSNGVAPTPLCRSVEGQDASPSQTTTLHWVSQWGAIATDEPHGVLGFSTGLSSASKAEKAAIEDCRTKGGANCTLQVSYANGCGAVVVGDTVFNVNWGHDERDASSKGIRACERDSKNCHVYFTTCSQATLAR